MQNRLFCKTVNSCLCMFYRVFSIFCSNCTAKASYQQHFGDFQMLLQRNFILKYRLQPEHAR